MKLQCYNSLSKTLYSDIITFTGHYFWLLDSNRVPGPPRGITQEWGVPSPIDTVFTRCNCQGKTYIFKVNGPISAEPLSEQRYPLSAQSLTLHGVHREVSTGDLKTTLWTPATPKSLQQGSTGCGATSRPPCRCPSTRGGQSQSTSSREVKFRGAELIKLPENIDFAVHCFRKRIVINNVYNVCFEHIKRF